MLIQKGSIRVHAYRWRRAGDRCYGDAELMDVYISDTISPHNFTAAVNRQMPAGMEIMNTYQVDSTLPSLQAQVTAAEYAVEVPSEKDQTALDRP